MEVAVGVDRLDLVALAESEADLRLFAGMQFLALVALLGVERDPLDVVLRQHGMLHRADLHMDDAVFHCPDGDMLLPWCTPVILKCPFTHALRYDEGGKGAMRIAM